MSDRPRGARYVGLGLTIVAMIVPYVDPVLRRYLAIAPGARPHIPVDRRAPLSEFEGIAHQYPVFRIRGR